MDVESASASAKQRLGLDKPSPINSKVGSKVIPGRSASATSKVRNIDLQQFKGRSLLILIYINLFSVQHSNLLVELLILLELSRESVPQLIHQDILELNNESEVPKVTQQLIVEVLALRPQAFSAASQLQTRSKRKISLFIFYITITLLVFDNQTNTLKRTHLDIMNCKSSSTTSICTSWKPPSRISESLFYY